MNYFVFSVHSRRGASDGVIVSIYSLPNLGFPTRSILIYIRKYIHKFSETILHKNLAGSRQRQQFQHIFNVTRVAYCLQKWWEREMRRHGHYNLLRNNNTKHCLLYTFILCLAYPSIDFIIDGNREKEF